MNLNKIITIVTIALAVLAAFINIQYVALILAVIGAYVGWGVEGEIHVRVIVSALALHAFSGIFDTLPGVGHYLTAILGNVSIGLAGIAVGIISHNLVRRLMK